MQNSSPANDLPQTINEIFAYAASHYNKENAFSFKRDGKWISISHEQFSTKVLDAYRGLEDYGIVRGDCIGLLSENRVEWTLMDFAILSCGAVTVPIYATSTEEQIEYILNDAKVKALCISTESQLAKILRIANKLEYIKLIILFDPCSAATDFSENIEVLMLEHLMDRGHSLEYDSDNSLDQLSRVIKSDDLATLIYTSGTTGTPKGVMLTHGNLASNVINSLARLRFYPSDISLSYLPLSHIFERTLMYAFIYGGVTVYFAESVNAVAQNLVEICPTVMTSVPRVFEKILAKIESEVARKGNLIVSLYNLAMKICEEHAKLVNQALPISFWLSFQNKIAYTFVLSKIHKKIGPSIRFFISGGAALSEDIAYKFAAIGFPIMQGYGLTETSPVICANTLKENRIGTVGKPIIGTEVKIAEDGEILVRGPNVMKGYLNKPKETAEVFKDGWFYTGDVGYLDVDGFLKITDRKKDLFKTSGGKYIAPQPIENKLTTSPFILQAVIIGKERKFPSALIVPDIKTLINYADQNKIKYREAKDLLIADPILELIRKEVDRLTPNLAQYEKIKKIALLENELTLDGGDLTPTLKVKRKVVEEKYKPIIDKLYEEGKHGSLTATH